VEQAVAVFSRLGIGPQTQVVAYDDAGGALAAVRVWWMLRWLGHTRVAVLDGGFQAWQQSGYLLSSGEEVPAPQQFVPHLRPELAVTTAQVDALRQDAAYRLMDARTFERFRGENETIDPVAGHIPGAVSAPYTGNLTPDGRFRPPEELRRRYEKCLAGVPAENSLVYCGSGVTSIHNLLAMQHAGLGEGRLYVGSWSEWIVDPSRPIATGPD
jgi:thiosulfate/3-mercaptopyruvate sulfurtransferase